MNVFGQLICRNHVFEIVRGWNPPLLPFDAYDHRVVICSRVFVREVYRYGIGLYLEKESNEINAVYQCDMLHLRVKTIYITLNVKSFILKRLQNSKMLFLYGLEFLVVSYYCPISPGNTLLVMMACSSVLQIWRLSCRLPSQSWQLQLLFVPRPPSSESGNIGV